MGQPVVHFEVIGADPARQRGYYAELFGWSYQQNSAVAAEVCRPGNYPFIDRMTTDDGTSIPGGVGAFPAPITALESGRTARALARPARLGHGRCAN